MRLTETEKLKMIENIRLKFNIPNVYEAIEFVSEMLELEIEYTKQNEPYATNSIAKMGIANHYVRNLLDVIDEMRNKQ